MSSLVRVLVAVGLGVLLAAGCGANDEPAADQADDSSTTTAPAPEEAPTTSLEGDAADSDAPDAGTDDVSSTTVAPGRWPTPPAELDPATPALWTVEVIGTAPHDPDAFTQGLERLDDDRLLESTGRRGLSDVRIVDPTTGTVERSAALEPEEFGEGLTVVGETVVQLTWQEEVARRWSLPDLTPLPPFTYEGEGWGLCLADDRLAMSDGTADLAFRDPETFAVLDAVSVRRSGEPVVGLNELECVDGVILANVWRTPEIVMIHPDGSVVATIDAGELVDTIASDDPAREVLNGIAAHPDGTFSLTGKLWPTRFVVRIVES